MSAQGNVVQMSQPDTEYSLAGSEATKMLAAGLKRAEEEKGLSQRSVAKLLNYKSSVVLSHMALGRVPIPIDRSLEIARLLRLDQGAFLLAVLKQRHPDIDFERLLPNGTKSNGKQPARAQQYVVDELEAIAGRSLDDLPVDKVNIMREVVGDPSPDRRWVGFGELPTIEMIRKIHPRGISPTQRGKLQTVLETL